MSSMKSRSCAFRRPPSWCWHHLARVAPGLRLAGVRVSVDDHRPGFGLALQSAGQVVEVEARAFERPLDGADGGDDFAVVVRGEARISLAILGAIGESAFKGSPP